MHIDLKRDLNSHIAARANNTLANVGLFEKYGFLSPGKPIMILANALHHIDTQKASLWVELQS